MKYVLATSAPPESSSTFNPAIVTVLVLAVIIFIVLITVLCVAQNPNPNYTSTLELGNPSIGMSNIYVYPTGSNVAIQDTNGAITPLTNIELVQPSSSLQTSIVSSSLLSLSSGVKAPYYFSGGNVYFNYYISIYNQVNDDTFAVGVTNIRNSSTEVTLKIISDQGALGEYLPELESNTTYRKKFGSYYYPFEDVTRGGIVDAILLTFGKEGLEAYYYRNDPDFFGNNSYTSTLIAMCDYSFSISLSPSDFVSSTFTYSGLDITIPQDVFSPPNVVISSSPTLTYCPGSVTPFTIITPTTVTKSFTGKVGFGNYAVLPYTPGSVQIGNDVFAFEDLTPISRSELSTVLIGSNLYTITNLLKFPIEGRYGYYISASDSTIYILSIVTNTQRYVVLSPGGSDVTITSLNALGDYGSNDISQILSSPINYTLAIISSSSLLVGEYLLNIALVSGSVVISVDSVQVSSTPLSSIGTGQEFLIGSGVTLITSPTTYVANKINLSFFGGLELTSTGSSIRALQR